MNGIVYTKEEIEHFKKTGLRDCLGCLFLHLKKIDYCNTTSAHCTRQDGHSVTFLTTECGIEPPKTHD